MNFKLPEERLQERIEKLEEEIQRLKDMLNAAIKIGENNANASARWRKRALELETALFVEHKEKNR